MLDMILSKWLAKLFDFCSISSNPPNTPSQAIVAHSSSPRPSLSALASLGRPALPLAPSLSYFHEGLFCPCNAQHCRNVPNKNSKGNLGDDGQSICLLALDRSKIDLARPGLSDAMLFAPLEHGDSFHPVHTLHENLLKINTLAET